MKTPSKNFFTWLIIFAVVMTVSQIIGGPDGASGNKLIFSEFMKKVDAGEVEKVDIKGSDLIGKFKSGGEFYTYLPEYPNLVESLQEKGVESLVACQLWRPSISFTISEAIFQTRKVSVGKCNSARTIHFSEDLTALTRVLEKLNGTPDLSVPGTDVNT